MEAKPKPTIQEYFEVVLPHIDISFMDVFLKLAEDENPFPVHQDMLKIYGGLRSLINIKAYLDKNKLVENINYVKQQEIYMLSRDAFKLCLFSAEHTIKYAYYYLMLEKISVLYDEYLDALNAS